MKRRPRALLFYRRLTKRSALLRVLSRSRILTVATDLLSLISDPFAVVESEISNKEQGLIIGRTNLPVVNEGDALFHIAETVSADAESRFVKFTTKLAGDPMFDEDEII